MLMLCPLALAGMQEDWEFPQTPGSLRAGDWGSKLWPCPNPGAAPATAPAEEAAEPPAQPAAADKLQEPVLAPAIVSIQARAAEGHSGQRAKAQDRQAARKAASASRPTARSAVAASLLLLGAAVIITLLASGLGRRLATGQLPGLAGLRAPEWQWPLHRLGALVSNRSSQSEWHSEQDEATNAAGDDRALVSPSGTCECFIIHVAP